MQGAPTAGARVAGKSRSRCSPSQSIGCGRGEGCIGPQVRATTSTIRASGVALTVLDHKHRERRTPTIFSESTLTMIAVILAGGFGTRIGEESHLRPKPMIEIGGKPILWHIMKTLSARGVRDFVICCGYKGYMIKEYFANYFLHMSDMTIDIRNNRVKVHQNSAEPWQVTLVDTG